MNRLMMVIISALIVPVVLLAQINWTEHIVSETFDFPYSVYAIDLDDDEDVDVLGAASNADDITWWENDGNQNFTEHTIKDNYNGANAVFAIDLDGDNDIDVLGTASDADDITWWENDGDENYTEHTIKGDYDGASSVFAIDLDDDNDIDVLGTAGLADDVTWWENDGDENFTEHTIKGDFNGARSVYAIDIEPDGDMDVLAVAYFADDITWWENDGNENFTEHTIKGDYDGAYLVFAIDMDDDNDIDILGTASIADDITWWENNGFEYFTEHTIRGDFNTARSLYAIDLDNDEDIDVLGGAGSEHKFAWWENDGDENFTEYTIDSTFDWCMSLYVIDVDGDTDIDVLGAGGDNINWWKSDLVSMDVSTVSIDISETLTADTTFNPQASVKNLGSDNASFDVICVIEPGAYTETETVLALAPNDSIQITFSDPFTFVGGLYTVTVYTQLAGDENPANDTLVQEVEAIRIDVGPISIDIPETVPEDTTLNPLATVKNLGTHTETFPVTCEIDPGEYTKTQTIQNLAPGDSAQVTFFTEFTFESGTYTVTVYTKHGDDDNPANDTLEKVIQTQDPGVVEGSSDMPEAFSFSAPTIIRGKAQIELALPQATKVDLLVYDIVGRLSKTIISSRLAPGMYNLNIDMHLPGGVYFYKLKTDSGEDIIQKFLLIE